jgi:hypothetical protein
VSDAELIARLMKLVNAKGYSGRVLVYSRGGTGLDDVMNKLAGTHADRHLKTLNLDGRTKNAHGVEIGDEDCFADGRQNGKLMASAIQSALRFQSLYSTTF